MDKLTLEKCLDGLYALRTSKHRTLDASVVAELDAVIFLLERCLDTDGEIEIDRDLSERVLAVLARCLEIVTNLSEIIKWFLDSD